MSIRPDFFACMLSRSCCKAICSRKTRLISITKRESALKQTSLLAPFSSRVPQPTQLITCEECAAPRTTTQLPGPQPLVSQTAHAALNQASQASYEIAGLGKVDHLRNMTNRSRWHDGLSTGVCSRILASTHSMAMILKLFITPSSSGLHNKGDLSQGRLGRKCCDRAVTNFCGT